MVIVFKTSVNSIEQVKLISNILNSEAKIKCWNFDLEDIDNILRVETEFEITEEIMVMMENLNFYIEELV